MFRKRRQPTPYFKLPPPYNPTTGEHAALAFSGVFPYVAMMQVAADDTHNDYVICRGFDLRTGKFVDYEDGNTDKPGIPVAKPYGKRRKGVYTIAQVYPAVLPLQSSSPSPSSVPWRVGQNPGWATGGEGHPQGLDEEIDFLKDDDDVPINWQLLDEGGGQLVGGCLAEDHPGRGTVFGIWLGEWDSANHEWDYDNSPAHSNPAIDWRYGVPYPDQGATGLFAPRASDDYGTIWEVVALDCDVPADHSCGTGTLPSVGS
jgi:hypothetical protein